MDYLHLKSLSELIIKAIGKYAKDNSTVLDVGCGSKPYYSLFEGRVREYIGVDIRSNSVDCIGDAESLPFRPEAFDIVISTQALEHIKSPNKAVEEIYRVLKKDGVVFASTHGIWIRHNDYWRWTDEGLKVLFSKFTSVQVMNEGGAILCFFQILNIYLSKIPIKVIKTALFLINNLLGRKLDSPKWDQFVINYLVIAKKDGV